MEIPTTGGVLGPDPLRPDRVPAGRFQKSIDHPQSADRAEISDHARFLSKIRDLPPIRRQKVEQLRALIASGQYETPEIIARAVTRILEELD